MKRAPLIISSCVLAIILAITVGCAKKPDDAKISSDVQSRFSQDSGLSTKQLTVQSANGVVTISGTVDNDAQRDAAARQAAAVAGVKEVVNNLQVAGAAPAPPAAAPATEAAPAQTATAPPAEKPKLAPGKKSHRSHASQNADNGDNSAASQMAGNQAPPPPAQAAAPQDNTAMTPPPPPPPPPPRKFIIDQGTQVNIRLIDPIDSEKNQTGDSFHATLNAPLTSDGEEAVPAGVEVTGHLVEVKSAGKFAGQSTVAMQLDSIASGGQTYNVQSDIYRKSGSSRGKNTAEKVGGGALVGTLIGALAGGGKGAAIGAAAGAGVGGGVQAATKAQQIKFPSETVLTFTLQAPVTVIQAPKQDSNRQKLSTSQ